MGEDASEALRARLKKASWKKGLGEIVGAAVEDDEPAPGLARLANLATERTSEGKKADGVRLAVAMLSEHPPKEHAEDRDRTMANVEQWARWRMHLILREHGSDKDKAKLSADDQQAVDSQRAEPIELPIDDLDAVEQRITDRLATSGAGLGDGVWAVAQAVAALDTGEYAAILRAARTALARVEKAHRDLGEAGEICIAHLRQDLWSRLIAAWTDSDDSDPETVSIRRWLTGSSGGKPRTALIHPTWINETQRDTLLSLLGDKHERSQTSQAYGLELLRLGREALGVPRRIELAREVNAVGFLMEALIEDGQVDEAVTAALAEAKSTAGCGEPLQRAGLLESAGRDDAALELMDLVTQRSVDVRHFEWLAKRLRAAGRVEDAIGIRKRLFDRRCGLATYESLRDVAEEDEWSALRKELIGRLEERRLFRIILDIAFAEDDVKLAVSTAKELDEHQKEYVRQRLDARDDAFARTLSEAVGEAAGEPIGSYRPRESVIPPARVKHKKYGVGAVLSHTGDGEHRKLEVKFKNFGKKTILERFLEPLD